MEESGARKNTQKQKSLTDEWIQYIENDTKAEEEDSIEESKGVEESKENSEEFEMIEP